MSLKCGIVGLPNVGKSTLFNCLSNAKAQAANFPFCTIEPNVGIEVRKGLMISRGTKKSILVQEMPIRVFMKMFSFI